MDDDDHDIQFWIKISNILFFVCFKSQMNLVRMWFRMKTY